MGLYGVDGIRNKNPNKVDIFWGKHLKMFKFFNLSHFWLRSHSYLATEHFLIIFVFALLCEISYEIKKNLYFYRIYPTSVTVSNRTKPSFFKNTSTVKSDVFYPPLHATLHWKIHRYIKRYIRFERVIFYRAVMIITVTVTGIFSVTEFFLKK